MRGALVFVIFLRLCLHSLFADDYPGATVTREVYLMGTSCRITAQAPSRQAALAATEAALRELEETEARLSTWRQDSELARVNAAPLHLPIPLSPRLCGELQEALSWARRSGGAFDPTVGWLVAAYDLRGMGRLPSPAELAAARSRTGFRHLSLSSCSLTKKAPVVLEEGGFGKGAALAAALAAAAPLAAALQLDLGGQLAWSPGELVVGLRHPQETEKVVAVWRLPAGSVATSGNGERGLWVDGKRLSHILDPRTGKPAEDFGAVSVWAPDPLAADCLSTALFVLGPEAGLRWLRRIPGVPAVFFRKAGDRFGVLATASARKHLELLDPDFFWMEERRQKAAAGGTKPCEGGSKL